MPEETVYPHHPFPGTTPEKKGALPVPELYIDGIETIHMINGAVRLDLFSLQPPREAQGQPEPQVRERLIMPLPTFLNMHDAMGRIVDKLVEDGIITRQKPNNEGGAAN